MLLVDMEVLTPSFVDDLYRIAFLLTGDTDLALSGVMEVVSEAECNATHWRTDRHRFLWAARLLSQRLSKKTPVDPSPSGAVSGEAFRVVEVLQMARPEFRAGLAMVCTGHVKSAEVLQLLRYRSREWRVALVRFREQLAESGLHDEGLKDALRSLQLSAQEVLALEEAVKSRPRRRRGSDKILAVAAVCLGFCALFGWFAWERWRDSPSMRMRSRMEEFLELNQNAGIAGLELFEGRAGETQDWLFLHGIEGVVMPAAFSNVKIVAARVLKWNGTKIAQFPTNTLPGLLVVADSDALGLPEEGSDAGRSSLGDWSGAWASAGQYKILWMVQADRSRLGEELEKLSKLSPPE